METANELLTQHTAIEAGLAKVAKDARRRRTEAIAAAFVVAMSDEARPSPAVNTDDFWRIQEEKSRAIGKQRITAARGWITSSLTTTPGSRT